MRSLSAMTLQTTRVSILKSLVDPIPCLVFDQINWCGRVVFFFFLMIRPPPSSTLFPYPTLFRSQLVDAGAPAVAGPTALVAAAPAVGRPAPRALDPERLEVGGVWRVGHATGGADPPHEPLREHAFEHGGDQVRLHPHILQSRDRTGRVVRVERGEHQVAREPRLDGDLRRLEVADLADEDHVRVLPNDVPEPRGEREADLRLHVDLVDALELVLDRVLDGDDLPVGRVDLVERAVERRRLAGARRPGDEQDPVRALDERLEPPERARREAELLHREEP